MHKWNGIGGKEHIVLCIAEAWEGAPWSEYAKSEAAIF